MVIHKYLIEDAVFEPELEEAQTEGIAELLTHYPEAFLERIFACGYCIGVNFSLTYGQNTYVCDFLSDGIALEAFSDYNAGTLAYGPSFIAVRDFEPLQQNYQKFIEIQRAMLWVQINHSRYYEMIKHVNAEVSCDVSFSRSYGAFTFSSNGGTLVIQYKDGDNWSARVNSRVSTYLLWHKFCVEKH